MAKLTNNTNFFKERKVIVAAPQGTPAARPAAAAEETPSAAPQESPAVKAAAKAPEKPAPAPQARPAAPSAPVQIEAARPISLSGSAKEIIERVNGYLEKLNQPKAQEQLDKALQSVKKDLFSIAVVGEFSTGKSSLINRLLGRPLLPVSTLPTTALLTRIRPYTKDSLIYIDANGARTTLPVAPESWDKLVVQNLGEKEIEGMALVGLNSPFLQQAGIELLDTPGAGDLSQKRARITGDALMGADGAVIVVSATKALSQSEKLFVQQRLITQHTPFMLVALTKLDMVAPSERNSVVNYVQRTLEMWQKEWNVQIPLYIAGQVELPDDTYQAINGDDKILQRLLAWRNDPDRAALTERWLLGKAESLLNLASMPLMEKKALMDASDEKRMQALQEKRMQLSSAKLNWEPIMLQLEQRCTDCYEAVSKKAESLESTIVEELVFNVRNAPKPSRWWEETYPYLLKTRLATMSATLENLAVSHINSDARWLNATLEKQFHSSVLVSNATISQSDDFDRNVQPHTVATKDIDKTRTKYRVTTACLTLAGCMVCMATGSLPMLATMGIGTGASIITERNLNKQRSEQIAEIIAAVKENVPVIIHEAMAQTRKRITHFYDELQRESRIQQELWFTAQKDMLEKSAHAPTSDERTALNELLMERETLATLLKKHLN